MRGAVLVFLVVGACGGKRTDDGAGPASGAAVATIDAAPQIPDPPRLPLGAASPAEADYRHGPGASAYVKALAAEKQADWPGVIAACREARAADPHHIDAAWLEAAAFARQRAFADMIEPLGVAAAGDWGKWGERSLVLPLYKDFLASPYGAAWTRAAQAYRDAYAASLARALPVIVRRDAGAKEPGPAELFAFDPIDQRWLRLTRGGGAVVAVIDAPGASFTAYVTFRDVKAGKGVERRIRVGAVDRASGRAGRELELPATDAATLSVAWRPSKTSEPSLEIETAPAHGVATDWRVDWRRGAKTKIKGPIPARGAIVTAHGTRRRRLPVADVTADWDDDGSASAFRVATSNKTVEPPGASLVDGNTLAWSPDRARVAFATAPAEPCAAAAPAQIFAVDAASGKLHAFGDADDPGQLRWLDADHLAYVTGGAIRVVDVPHDRESSRIEGGGGLALDGWIVRSGCDHGDTEAVFALDPGEPEPEPEPDVPPPTAPVSVDAGSPDASR
ncbi:MAG TPA: hypothetical protein VL463_02615 [Kofleriaceae bacterium]|nr:hypothetical protein [Kofleriaceae bacterium]